MLLDNRQKEKLEIVAQALLEKETIFQADLEKLIGKRSFDQGENKELENQSEEDKD